VTLAVLFAASFLYGAIPFSFLIGKWFYGKDIRTLGSRNPGSTNLFRVLGPKAGIPGFVLDMTRGLLPVLAARAVSPNSYVWLGAGISALLGNIFTPFLGFKGGKGVTATLGAFIALTPVPALVAFLVWALCFILTRYVSLSSILAAFAFPFAVWVWGCCVHSSSLGLLGVSIAVCLVIIVRHQANIRRLLSGQEKKLELRRGVRS
jgi:acyl phosphate:glycerol-3-phosphate acyltransferase